MQVYPDASQLLGENGRRSLESAFTVEQYAASVEAVILKIAHQPQD